MKNNYKIIDGYVYISLQKGKYQTKISLCDFERANNFPGTWRAAYEPTVKGYYVRGHIRINEKWTTMPLHRWLKKVTDFKIKVDHKNHDGLDNTDENLNVVTNAENCQNTKAKGYHLRKRSNKYETYIDVNGKRKWLGSFKHEEDAKIAYATAKMKYHKYYASIAV